MERSIVMQANQASPSERTKSKNGEGSAKPLSRSRKSAKKRDAIIRAAIEVINKKSYALATMGEIAASLDLRDAALYYYFPSKQALVYACHIRSLERFDALIERSDGRGGSGALKLRRAIEYLLVDSVKNGPHIYFGDYSYLEEEERRLVAESAEKLRQKLELFLVEGMADKSIEPCEPALTVQLILGMLIWLAKWADDIDHLTVERLMNAVDGLVFNGLGSAVSA